MTKRIQNWLNTDGSWLFPILAMVAAFSSYLCMYAFRKPFTAATYESLELWGISYKVVLVISQVFGYMLSKFIGIKVVSEMKPERRVGTILLLIGVAWLALLGVALVGYPYALIFFFFNGLPLGMIWGLVFSFLEGRRLTELLGAGLAASFIVGSGWVKGVSRYLMFEWGVSEFWMPFMTGAVFALPLLVSVWLLSLLPPPNEADIAQRTVREPMSGKERMAFFKAYGPGIVMIIAIFVILTAYRDFRDKFEVEIWEGLGYAKDEIGAQLASANTIIGFTVTGLLAFFILVKNNYLAFWGNMGLLIVNSLMLFASMFLFFNGYIDAYWWMISIGFWMYMSYVSYHNVLLERFISVSGVKGNYGFLMYLADSSGYLGSIILLLYKEIWYKEPEGGNGSSWLEFFYSFTYIAGALMILFTLISIIYFIRRFRQKEHNPIQATT
ncbi:MAG: DUF5690 family protein [Bacteroidota bacterium]